MGTIVATKSVQKLSNLFLHQQYDVLNDVRHWRQILTCVTIVGFTLKEKKIIGFGAHGSEALAGLWATNPRSDNARVI